MTPESFDLLRSEFVGRMHGVMHDAMKEASRLLAINTPMAIGFQPSTEMDAVADEMDKAREHIANAQWKLRAMGGGK